MRPFVDHTGKRFGRLVVTSLHSMRDPHPGRDRGIWSCKCDCGKTTTSSSSDLVRGDSQSCGCLQIERTVQAHTIPEQKYGINRCLDNYVKSATKRDLKVDLSRNEMKLLMESSCWYCSKPPRLRTHKGNRKSGPINFHANGIDRIDNNIGYTFTNSVPCCDTCNYMKETLSLIEFVNHIDRIAGQSSSISIFNKEI